MIELIAAAVSGAVVGGGVVWFGWAGAQSKGLTAN